MVGHPGNAPGELKHRVYNPVRLFNGLLTHFKNLDTERVELSSPKAFDLKSNVFASFTTCPQNAPRLGLEPRVPFGSRLTVGCIFHSTNEE